MTKFFFAFFFFSLRFIIKTYRWDVQNWDWVNLTLLISYVKPMPFSSLKKIPIKSGFFALPIWIKGKEFDILKNSLVLFFERKKEKTLTLRNGIYIRNLNHIQIVIWCKPKKSNVLFFWPDAFDRGGAGSGSEQRTFFARVHIFFSPITRSATLRYYIHCHPTLFPRKKGSVNELTVFIPKFSSFIYKRWVLIQFLSFFLFL